MEAVRCAGEHLAAVAPSGWRGPLINELSQPRSLGGPRGHTSVCHSGLTPSPSPAASRSPGGFSRCSKVSTRGTGATVPRSPSWHCVCDTWARGVTFLQSWGDIKAAFLPVASALRSALSVLFQMMIWLAGVWGVCDKGSCLWWHVCFEINLCF